MLVTPGPVVTAATRNTRQPRDRIGGEQRGCLVANVDDANATRLGVGQDG
jgi:hypothetical protein